MILVNSCTLSHPPSQYDFPATHHLQAATASAELAHAGGEPQLRGRRHLQALRSSSGGDAAPLRAGLAEAAHSTSYLDATAARVCALQCQQHACISWHKVYFGEGEEGGSAQPAASIPAAAADCLSAACGVEPLAASCLAQVRFEWGCHVGVPLPCTANSTPRLHPSPLPTDPPSSLRHPPHLHPHCRTSTVCSTRCPSSTRATAPA